MPDKSDLFEIMQTTRAMRRLKPDPVPDALIRKIIQAGVCAPNGGNSQRWRFLVVKHALIARQVQVYHTLGRAEARSRAGSHPGDAPPPLREGDRGRAGPAARRALVRHPSDRLSDGPLRSRRSRAAEGGRVRGPVGTPVSVRGGWRVKR